MLRQLARSHRHLAELNGAAATILNEAVRIDTLHTAGFVKKTKLGRSNFSINEPFVALLGRWGLASTPDSPSPFAVAGRAT